MVVSYRGFQTDKTGIFFFIYFIVIYFIGIYFLEIAVFESSEIHL